MTTRYNLLSDLLMSHRENREAIGKAWPLFFYLIFNMNKDNKLITSYPELKVKLNESPNTIKTWREHLSKGVVKVFKGSKSMTFILLPPYDSLVTCEQDDVTQVKMTGDPATRRLLDELTAYGNNMCLLPVVAKIQAQLEDIQRKIG